jgi:hypothetical protein
LAAIVSLEKRQNPQGPPPLLLLPLPLPLLLLCSSDNVCQFWYDLRSGSQRILNHPAPVDAVSQSARTRAWSGVDSTHTRRRSPIP